MRESSWSGGERKSKKVSFVFQQVESLRSWHDASDGGGCYKKEEKKRNL